MDGASLIGSLDRIEAALGRIEARAQEIGQDVGGPAAEGELELRHRALRASVQSALSRIDALLAEQTE